MDNEEYENEEIERAFTEFVQELHSLPEQERELHINTVALVIRTTMDFADDGGFLYEMLTEWPKKKIMMLEAAIAAQIALSEGMDL